MKASEAHFSAFRGSPYTPEASLRLSLEGRCCSLVQRESASAFRPRQLAREATAGACSEIPCEAHLPAFRGSPPPETGGKGRLARRESAPDFRPPQVGREATDAYIPSLLQGGVASPRAGVGPRSGTGSGRHRRGAAATVVVVALTVLLCLGGVLGIVLSKPVKSPNLLAAYSASLRERTPHQRHNAQLAARRLDGVVIPAGGAFSFNAVLGGWTASQGYLKAPVSYDGVLVDDYGGGVCETSTVVYNAALLAGLTVVERHPHTFAPSYVPPGRDAAVAYSNVDLKLRNPYRTPVVLHVGIEYGDLICRISGDVKDPPRVSLRSQTLDWHTAPRVPPIQSGGSKTARWNLLGRDGVRVAVYRDILSPNGDVIESTLQSDNTYRPMAGVVTAPH